ncbi:hypothetical protein DTO212C5_4645 [Paecilomyces variotii]|nr:hypothetical protein DTO212C5_4645 [Paecilomyces variotii]
MSAERSRETAEKTRRIFPNFSSQLSFAIVPKIAEEEAFDDAVRGVDGIIHTACPSTTQAENNVRDIIYPAINGTISLLTSAWRHAPQVKRVVITSSFAAMMDIFQGERAGHTYSEKDWNPMSYEEAARDDTSGVAAYCAAKKLAEQAAWDFMKEKKPNFGLVTILPPMVYGPNVNATNITQLNSTSADLYRLMSPESKPTDPVPANSFWSWVDVRDVADAHLKAYIVPEADNERFFICGGNFSYQQITDILREKVPDVRSRVPIGKPGTGFGGVQVYTPDASKSVKVLGLTYRNLTATVVDSARSYLELEKLS